MTLRPSPAVPQPNSPYSPIPTPPVPQHAANVTHPLGHRLGPPHPVSTPLPPRRHKLQTYRIPKSFWPISFRHVSTDYSMTWRITLVTWWPLRECPKKTKPLLPYIKVERFLDLSMYPEFQLTHVPGIRHVLHHVIILKRTV